VIEKINGLSLDISSKRLNQSPVTNNETFANHLKEALKNVDRLQKASDIKTGQLIRGENIDLHDVMITAQKASLSLETTVQIQRKVIDAYNEIMRMQV